MSNASQFSNLPDAWSFLEPLARSSGLCAVGLAPASPVPRHAAEAFEKWLRRGRHAKLRYMERNRELRLDASHPALLEGGAQIVLCAALPYADGANDEGLWRHVARHARGRDYHKTLKKILNRLGSAIRDRFPRVAFRPTVDSAPVLERAWAVAAGLGVIGKSGALIVPGVGPSVLLGELLLRGPLPDIPPRYPKEDLDLCKGCDACLKSCPTGAIVAPGVVDSRRCLSYLTVESPEEISKEFSKAQTKIFGCDICTEVCLHRNAAVASGLEPVPTNEGRALTLEGILLATDEEIEKALAGTALRRTGATKLRKNTSVLIARESPKKGQAT